ncbi:MAG: PAS domain S-box protein [Woeseia sp.]
MKIIPGVAAKFLETSTEALLIVDSQGTIVFANSVAGKLFGYGDEELVGEQIEILIPTEARERHVRHRQRYRGAPHARPLVSGLSLQGQRKNGETFAAEISLTPVESEGETLIASTVRDISAGDDSEAYFRHLLKAAPDAMVIVDANGRIAIANDQSESMFGYSHDELIGQPIETLLPMSVRERHVGHRRRFAEDPRLRPMGSGMELYARRADGSEFPVEISLSPITAASGMFVSSVIRDVTERREMEHELIEARRSAERAHKANTAFLAAASHDLRQPVQALSLLAGALRRTVKDELALEMIESQQHSLDAMTNLLNSLLDISRLDSGAITPETEDFPVQRLIDRLTSEFTRQARQKGLDFVATASDAIVRSDPNLLGEIIQNLVSNAVRYTNRGAVQLLCRVVDNALSIDVIDTGIGIAPEHIDSIFREFHQLKSDAPSNEGFGLGLAIVRRLADLLGLQVTVESTPGAGSCFSVSVPLVSGTAVSVADAVIAVTDPATLKKRAIILLVEDDRRVAAAWMLLLRAEGFRVALADSADSAEKVAMELGEPTDLIISDYHLLDASTGVQAVAAVRRYFHTELPALIVSGDTSKVMDDARGINNCVVLSKPVDTDELLALAHRVIASGQVDTD